MHKHTPYNQSNDDGQEIYARLLETCEPETAEGASIRIDRYDEKERSKPDEKPRRCGRLYKRIPREQRL